MNNAQQIIDQARNWLGVRWQHQGRSRLGVDCVGLCVCVAQDLSLKVEDIRSYPRRIDGRTLTAYLGQHLQPVCRDQGLVGDIGLFRDKGFPVHVGFLARKRGVETVIHAHAGRRKVIEEPIDVFGQPFALYRLKGII